MAPLLSVVIPTFRAATTLSATLSALEEARRTDLLAEVVIADGGSDDGTTEIARAADAIVIDAPRGRGPQLIAGAAAAKRGDWLLFLHADSRPAAEWSTNIARFAAQPENAGRAAAFRLHLDDEDPRARRIERLANWRSRALGLPYGDQGLLIARAFYDDLGGYRPLALMEDVDLARRIGRDRLVLLDCSMTTSAVRYRRGGWWARPLRNLALLGAYLLGVPPERLRRLYE